MEYQEQQRLKEQKEAEKKLDKKRPSFNINDWDDADLPKPRPTKKENKQPEEFPEIFLPPDMNESNQQQMKPPVVEKPQRPRSESIAARKKIDEIEKIFNNISIEQDFDTQLEILSDLERQLEQVARHLSEEDLQIEILRERIAQQKLMKITNDLHNIDERTIQQERKAEQQTLEKVLFNGNTDKMYGNFKPADLWRDQMKQKQNENFGKYSRNTTKC